MTRKLPKSAIVKVCKWFGIPDSLLEQFIDCYKVWPFITPPDSLDKEVGTETVVGVNNTLAAIRDGYITVDECLAEPSIQARIAAPYREPMRENVFELTRRQREADKYVDRGFELWADKWALRPCDDEGIRENLVDLVGPKMADRVCKEGYKRWMKNPDHKFGECDFGTFLSIIVLEQVPSHYKEAYLAA